MSEIKTIIETLPLKSNTEQKNNQILSKRTITIFLFGNMQERF